MVAAPLKLDGVECLFERRASGRSDIGSQALRDLDQFRRYVTGAGGHAVMDAPLGALFLGVLIILNIPLAVTALVRARGLGATLRFLALGWRGSARRAGPKAGAIPYAPAIAAGALLTVLRSLLGTS